LNEASLTDPARPVPLTIVTPVYEDAEASSRLFTELARELGRDVFVVAVDDGSVREPVRARALEQAGVAGAIVRLKRNVGHQRAIAIGLSYVADQGDERSPVAVMDSDGEDAPASVTQLMSMLGPETDIAVARRKKRVETLRFRAFYVVYKMLFRLLAGRSIDFGNFMALKPAAARRLVAMQELWIHVAGCVLTSKLRVAALPLDRAPRYAGTSKMNFVGLALHGFKALMVFAEDVLVRVGIACAIIAVLTIGAGTLAILLKLGGFATPGWFSVALGILFLVFLQTGALTLVSLMLTGVVRSGSVVTVSYRDFIEEVVHVQRVDAR
jgi:polyisoprenyl-phosphate glycosyltransferase